MTGDPAFLASGALPHGSPEVQIVAPIGRIGDALVYTARDGIRAARVREYAPAGVVRRLADGSLGPADERFAEAWEEGLGRFLDQGRQLAQIDHYAIQPVWHALGPKADGVLQGAYLVGAPIGEPLGAALATGLVIAPADVMRFAADLADALAELHARGLTHLAINPHTVSVASGWLELSDFAVDNRPFMPLLETQEGLVSPGYSPIEHYDASMADPLGPATDIYGASALLFRLITGREPPPWQECWRDPSAAALPDSGDYPADFLAAVREGMAIEPADRFQDGGAWREALRLPPVNAALHGEPQRHPPVPQPAAPAPPPPPPTEVRTGAWLPPLLLALALLLIALLGYLAYTQRWFVPAPDAPPAAANEMTSREPLPPPTRPKTEPAAPLIEVGSVVAGRLSASDQRRGGGQYEDRYTLDARGGERLEISLTSTDFDPLLAVTGPGFTASNDDDARGGTRDSRLVVTLPRAGRYTIAVTSYDRGESGAYLLKIAEAPPEPPTAPVTTIDLSLASRLTGRWHGADDPDCESPAVNSVSGDTLVSRIGGDVYRHRIVGTDGPVVRTIVTEGRLAGRQFLFRLLPDGDTYSIEGEMWLRC